MTLLLQQAVPEGKASSSPQAVTDVDTEEMDGTRLEDAQKEAEQVWATRKTEQRAWNVPWDVGRGCTPRICLLLIVECEALVTFISGGIIIVNPGFLVDVAATVPC